MRHPIAWGLLLASVWSLPGCGWVQDWWGQRVVRVGLYENAPKVYSDERGRAVGLFPELLDAMARRERWRLQYVPCAWADCLLQLERGELDLMPDVAFSAERAERFDFHAVSVANSWSQVYVQPSLKVQTLADLAGRRIAVLEGGIQQRFLEQLMSGNGLAYEPVPVSSLDEGYRAVLDGQADAVVTNSFFAARNGQKYRLGETPIVFLPTSLYFAAPKGLHPDLLAAIDRHIIAWRSDANSIYYDALRRTMSSPAATSTPAWMGWSLTVLLGVLVFLGGVTLMLRNKVRRRTQRLVEALEDLRQERANLEHAVAQRTAELRAAKEEAEALSRAKSDFLAVMSHEIRTPMNAILGMLYLALQRKIDPALRSQLTKAQGAARSLLGIINDILDFSKIEAGKLSIEQVEFGLDAVLEQLTDAIGYQAEQKGIEFLIRYDPAIPPRLIGDPLRLGQVLLNLCGNAIKFTERGEVELAFQKIAVDADGLILQVCVRDSGIGIPPELQRRLFEKFTQADQSTTRRFGGTGLGLAISRHLVELMGGRIWLERSQAGVGTTMCFTVRLKAPVPSAEHEAALREQAGPLLRGVRVLVVDDNQVSRDILAEMLHFFQVDVDTAADGPAAIERLRRANPPYDLVLMDWRMPGMNGDEVSRRIRHDVALPGKPRIVMVTAYGREEVIRQSEQAGVDGILIKPVSPSTLLDTTLSVLGRGRVFKVPEHERPRPMQTHAAGQLAGRRVLLVEDNDINREFAVELLRSEGIEVVEAVNGQEALERLQAQPFDAVLMDIQMPVMDGLEAARRIRAWAQEPEGRRFAQLPIIAMTALAMASDAELSRAAGMDDHVTKPISPERLFAALVRVWHLDGGLAQPTGREAATPFLDADLEGLHNLDAAEGVRRIGGNQEAYRRQLRRFRERYRQAVADLRVKIEAEGLPAAEAHCHALKGVTGNLGAMRAYREWERVDESLKAGRLPLPAVLHALQSAMDDLFADIDRLPADQPVSVHAAPLEGAALHERLLQLSDALEHDLGAVEPLLTELRAGVAGTPLQEPLDAIAALVDVFDIDTAQQRLRALTANA